MIKIIIQYKKNNYAIIFQNTSNTSQNTPNKDQNVQISKI